MSYSTRRGGGFGGQQQNVGNIGQRRPVVTNNFVPGGQNKPAGQATQQQVRAQQPQQQNTSIQFRNQGPEQQAKQQLPQAKQPQPQIKQQQPQAKVLQQSNQQQQQAQQQQAQKQQAQVQQQQAQVQQQQAQVQQQPTQVQQPAVQQQVTQQQQAQQQQIEMETTPAQNNAFAPSVENPENADMEAMDTSTEVKKKPFWHHNKGKIAKKERTRRRNVMLTRTLKPKNAVMVLNELVKNTTYAVEELPTKFNGNSFKATVVYEGSEHVGFGRNKMQAKNAAAETALKHFVKSHKLTEMKKDEEGNENMDLSEEDAQNPLPWQHVVSFALFKLFCSWEEGSNGSAVNSVHELKQAKKMPENPETVNPLMMVNQMLPQAHFEEIGKTGVHPNILFSFKCIVGEDVFIGTGSNKKAAKRMAAYGACHKILGINYPEDVYVPNY
nr:double-stranded RNA-binding protein Staufen homolog isoform X2 [Leptinotarsa decemlineata]